MNYRSISILILAFFVFSCSGELRKSSEKEAKIVEPFIFDLAHFFSEEELNISFPVWFNDSIIKKGKISSIRRMTYMSSTEKDTLNTLLKEIKTYHFTESGQVREVEVEHYYDNILVGSMSFTIEERDKFGFSLAVGRPGEKVGPDEEIQEQYRIYKKEDYTEKFLVYSDLSSGDYLFYMLNETNWGTLSVDTILHPTISDLIIFGTPHKPIKRYQVENRVNEFNVVNYSYNNADYLAEITFDKYPFHYKRSILYNDLGTCSGFVDSTFSNEKYLTRRESMFHFENSLPVRLIHENKSGKSETGYYQFETFEYDFWE